MIDEPVSVVHPVGGSRLGAYLRYRLGRRARRVRRMLAVPSSAGPAPTFAEIRGAAELWWVTVREFAEVRTFEVRVGAAGGRAGRVEVQLRWWVHDPRAVARHRAVDAGAFVYRDVEKRIRGALAGAGGAVGADGADAAADVDEARLQDAVDVALSHTIVLAEYGLGYRPVGAFLRTEPISADVREELDRARAAILLEMERQRLTLKRMEFHRELIREGPETLIAYWLTRFPDQIKAVVDHLDDRGMMRGADGAPGAFGVPGTPAGSATPRTPAGELLALLGDADDFERNQLRKALVSGLAASGPRGMAVLRELGWWHDLVGDDADESPS
ncbi:hypothetical protein ACFRCG_05385 [Embleya sp. NPDC056575]|uniref:hypothetical protein n=1 Tax=unclassified Embleya TaxID=2699296 RepID=UPI00369D16C0